MIDFLHAVKCQYEINKQVQNFTYNKISVNN